MADTTGVDMPHSLQPARPFRKQGLQQGLTRLQLLLARLPQEHRYPVQVLLAEGIDLGSAAVGQVQLTSKSIYRLALK
ncbi:hypothetical protein AK812_SmicGene6421 [Symbiodinium microadriaticum]|uniref:Uncharacterized protein n=1 Tax=Symbiodinium microadriaticum TaxID=2951 RepID=A0A1Q9ERB2_SYMMI|nr:hypothetical protein AK812_SmicGene6421 [Symbiodinium microadriaticum]